MTGIAKRIVTDEQLRARWSPGFEPNIPLSFEDAVKARAAIEAMQATLRGLEWIALRQGAAPKSRPWVEKPMIFRCCPACRGVEPITEAYEAFPPSDIGHEEQCPLAHVLKL